jgi:mRNA interferase RelE/StbE
VNSQEYRLIYHKAALKYLAKQEKAVQERIIKNIHGLLTNPMSGDIKRMEGDPGILRLKIWAYRVIFRLDKIRKVIHIDDIGPRGDIYKS